MVLITLADMTLKLTFWTIEKTYNGMVYLIYGHQETIEEKILKELEDTKKELMNTKKELDEIKDKLNLFYG